MKFVIKFSFWCLLVFCFWLSVSEIFLLSSGERDEPDAMLRSLSSLDKDSKSIFFVGSSRIQRSINSIILQDSLPYYKVFNMGLSGNTLAQGLFLAHYLSKKPGSKIVFIELTPFLNGFPNNFKDAGKFLNIPNFPDSYFFYIGEEKLGLNLPLLLNNLESRFWLKLGQLKFQLNCIFFDNQKSLYRNHLKKIGYSPTYISNYKAYDSFLVMNDIFQFSNEKVNLKMYNRVMQIIKEQKYKSFKVIFILPVTSLTKKEFKIEIPVFNKIPLNSKWDYDPCLLKMIANPEYLEDKNHMNELGAKIYTQNLLKYIKVHEKEW